MLKYLIFLIFAIALISMKIAYDKKLQVINNKLAKYEAALKFYANDMTYKEIPTGFLDLRYEADITEDKGQLAKSVLLNNKTENSRIDDYIIK